MRKILFITWSFISLSCEKGHIQQDNPNAPEISIHVNGKKQNYKKGDTIFIRALFKDSIELHDVSLELIDISSGTKVISIDEHRHVKSFSMDTFFVIPQHSFNAKYRLLSKANNHADKFSYKEAIIESIP